jgi:hypothetical protein
MKMTRKGFLGAAAGGTVALLLQACGGSDDDKDTESESESESEGTDQCTSSGAAISGNHGHALSIATSDLDSKSNKSYSIQAQATHDHTVTFTPAQLQALKAGRSITVPSATAFEHSHKVTATCESLGRKMHHST